MKELIIYQLEVACCLTLFYLFYWLILRKETNFHIKRLYFICTGIMAFVLPALHIQFNISPEEIPIEYINILPSQLIAYVPSPTPPDKVDVWMLFSILWGTGSAIMLFKLLFSLSNIGKILKETSRGPEGKSFKITNAKVQSFSFFKTIVINVHHYRSNAMKYILAHEQAHSDQYHSIDVLLVELLKTIQWCNPFAWLFAKESLQNLEYLADKEVTDHFKNTHDYQLAIVQFSHHSGSKLLRSEFSKSNLKNRIIMMNQQKNKKVSLLKLMLLLPLLAIIIMSFSIKKENLDLRKEFTALFPIFNAPSININDQLKTLSINKYTPSQVKFTDIQRPNDPTVSNDETLNLEEDQKARPYCGDMDSYYDQIYWALNYPEYAYRNRISGVSFVEFIVQKNGDLAEIKVERGIGFECDGEAIRIIKNGPKWIPAKINAQKVDSKVTVPVMFDLDNNARVQSRLLKGKVVSEDGISIKNAIIGILKTKKWTRSDSDGHFELRLNPEHDELEIVSIGWYHKKVDIRNLKKIEIRLKSWPEEAIKKCVEENVDTYEPYENRKTMLLEIEGDQVSPVEDQIYFSGKSSIRLFVNDSIARARYGESARGGLTIAVPTD